MKNTSKNSGFSVIEIISVLLIVGILAMVVVSRFINSDAEEIARTEVVKNHLRYAQLMAMKSNSLCGIRFTGASYAFFRNGDLDDTAILPGHEAVFLSLPAGKTAAEIVTYDHWGIPYTDAEATSGHTGGQIGDLNISIVADTGFVQ